MSNIIVFGHEIRSKDAQRLSFFKLFQDTLAQCFKELGHNAIQINFTDGDWIKKLNEALRDKIDFAIVFNMVHSHVLQLKLPDGENVLNRLNIPLVSWFWDAIFDSNNPAARSGDIKHLLIACIDKDELDEIKCFSPHVEHAFFLPIAGTQRNSRESSPLRERKYRISYIGSSYSVDRKWSSFPPEIASVINDVIDLVLADPMIPVITAAREVLKARGMGVSDNWFRTFCFKYLKAANVYVRGWGRRELIRTLSKAGIMVDVWGDTTGNLQGGWAAERRINFHGPCFYEESLDIIADSQLTLNVGMFPNGLHDRVTTAMLNGTIAVTDPSAYYHQNFVDGEDSICYDWKHLDELPHKIVDLLSDEDRMQAMADLGRQKALAAHTWTHRAQTILEQVQLYKAVVGI